MPLITFDPYREPNLTEDRGPDMSGMKRRLLEALGVQTYEDGIIQPPEKDVSDTQELIEAARKSLAEAIMTRTLRSRMNNQLADTLKQARENMPNLPYWP